MRRVSVEKAQPGMELARPACDLYGTMLMPGSTELTRKHIDFLKERPIWELLIEDRRVPELTIKHLVKPEMQRESIDAMRRLLNMSRDPNEKKNMKDPEMYAARVEVDRLGFAIVQAVLKSPLGEPDLTGSGSPEEFHFVLPVQITALAILLAREAGMDPIDIANVGRAAMLQNTGYIWTPRQIWENEHDLSEEDRKVFEKHPIHGAEAVGQLDRTSPAVVEAILHHHERWDGSGYPNGIKGWDISPLAQIIGMAETFYEATSTRPNRKAYSPMDAFECVMAYMGEWFDPELVQVFARRVPVFPSGIMVKLNNRQIGIIIDVNIGHVGRPVIRVCYDTQGNATKPPFDADLSDSEHQLKLITEILDI
ncbi:MAG: HD domain-containing protein [Chloroflexi bacterium]|nr:HD domain-containing protein [Chloroflexota bacterium]